MDKVFFFLAGIAAALAAYWARYIFLKKCPPAEEEELQKKREDILNELKNTPAADLVDHASNADELLSNAKDIARKFRDRLRDRTGTILSGVHRDTIDGNGGDGD